MNSDIKDLAKCFAKGFIGGFATTAIGSVIYYSVRAFAINHSSTKKTNR